MCTDCFYAEAQAQAAPGRPVPSGLTGFHVQRHALVTPKTQKCPARMGVTAFVLRMSNPETPSGAQAAWQGPACFRHAPSRNRLSPSRIRSDLDRPLQTRIRCWMKTGAALSNLRKNRISTPP